MNGLAPFIILVIVLSFLTIFNLPLNVIFNDSLPKLPNQMIELGQINDDSKINLTIGLKMQNQSYLEALITSVKIATPIPHSLLEQFLPSNEAYKRVLDFVAKANPYKITTFKDRLLISFEANAKNIENLLKVKIYKAYYNGSIYYYSTSPILSGEIAQYIEGFAGLNN